jgi:hypothetical protein
MCSDRRGLQIPCTRRRESGQKARTAPNTAKPAMPETGARAAMLPTALAMAPRHPFRLTSGDKAYRAAETATLELVGHGAGLRIAGLHRTLLLSKSIGASYPKLATVLEVEPAELLRVSGQPNT